MRKIQKLILLLLLAVLLAPTLADTTAQAAATESDGYLVQMNAEAGMLLMEDTGMKPVSGIEGLYRVATRAEAEALLEQGAAAYIEPNVILEPLDTAPDDTYYSQQWTLSAIGYPQLYASGLDGAGVTVAIIDSGLYTDHEDFAETAVSEFSRNFLGDDTEESRALYTRDQRGHGTFVASQISPATNNGKGIAGIAGGAELMVLRCISKSGCTEFPYSEAYDANSGTVAVVAAAIRYAADNGADVINISLGTTVKSTTLSDAVAYAQGKGAVIVAAAGNGSGTALYYPAACDGVIGVGSVSRDGDALVKSDFSQYNKSVDLTAPGGSVAGIQIYLTDGGLYTDTAQSYVYGSGTSYSAPVVSALAAAVKQSLPSLDSGDVLSLLAASATDKGSVGYDTSFGYGVVSASGLVTALGADYEISYTLNDSEDAPATLPTDAATTYKLDTSVTLPVPTRGGYLFDGWYTDAGYAGTAVTVQPAGTLGELGGVSIEPVKYYAKWTEISLIVPYNVTVCGYPAAAGEGSAYAVKLPAGSLESLDSLAASDIAVAVQTVATASEISGGAGSWGFSVMVGGNSQSYTLTVTLSEHSVPTVAGAMTRTGQARLASLDGKLEALAFTADASDWFENETGCEVLSCDGSGSAAFSGKTLIYTPGAGDYVGQIVTVTVRGVNADFQSADNVTAQITVGRNPSDSTLSQSSFSYDIYTGGSRTVTAALFDNTFSGISCDGEPLAAGSYSAVISGDGENLLDASIEISLMEQYLQGLTVGEHTLSFLFSAGSAAPLTLTVSDSAPRYSVMFYLSTGDNTAYETYGSIREGATLASLPVQPTKSGSIFTGWYLSGGTTRVTAATAVTGDLNVYASWSNSGSTSGGTTGGTTGGTGGGSMGGGPAAEKSVEAPADATAYTQDDLPSDIGAEKPAVLTVEAGDVSAALTQEAAASIASADADLVVSAANGKMTFSPKSLEALGAEAGQQLVFSLRRQSPDSGTLEKAGLEGEKNIFAFSVSVAIIAADDETKTVSSFDSGVELCFALGAEWADKTVNIVHLLDDGTQESSTVKADENGDVSLTVYHFSTFLIYAIPDTIPFSDVSEDSWYYSDVLYAYQNGLMNGAEDDAFAPLTDITRGMIVTILYRLENEPETGGKCPFSDVKSGSYYENAVIWASEQGIVEGNGDGSFRPEAEISREQLAAILWRYAKYKEYDVSVGEDTNILSYFDAESISAYAIPAMQWACGAGLINGDGGRLLPQGNATRAQAAAVLHRFCTGVMM